MDMELAWENPIPAPARPLTLGSKAGGMGGDLSPRGLSFLIWKMPNEL